MRKIALFLFLFAVPAFAQFTTVTGTVIDPNGVPYALGTIQPTLVIPSGAGSPTLNGQPYSPPSQPVGLDKSGSFSFNVADNTILLPAGTKWNFQVCSATGTVQPAIGTGPQCFSLAAPITISGSTQSLTTQLHAVALALTVPLTGGGSPPASPIGSLQTNLDATHFGSIPSVAPGNFLTSVGTGTAPVYQTKLTYDLRDAHPPAAAFACDGTTYDTLAASALISAIGGQTAKVQGAPGAVCAMGDFVWPQNVVLDFSTGWKLKTPTDSTTTPGNGTFNTGGSATGHCQSDNTTTTCNMNVTATANDTYIIACGRGFTGGSLSFSSNVSTDVVLPLVTTSVGLSSVSQAALIPSVVSGAHTFTATSPNANLIGSCTAVPISGLGPTPYTVDAVAICNNSSPNSPYQCTGSFTAGDFLLFVASQNNTGETCTGAGGGFTLIPGSAGCSTTTISNLAISYQNSAAGGSVTPTIAFTPSPAGHNPSSLIIGLRPASAINQILGGINNPANNQIFVNATGTAGFIDFTGNTVGFNVWPEWWGALGNNSTNAGQQTTNTAAVNSSMLAAFGNQNRINGSGLQIYNKPLRFCGTYNVNGQINFIHVNSFVIGGCGRLLTNLNETATNTTLWAGYQDAYGVFEDMTFSTSASQDIAHPLMIFDFNPALGADFAPQFLDFVRLGISGNGTAAIGLIGAPSGGGAQFSNIYFYDVNALNFTQACYQIGTPTALAQNALAIAWFGGDIQGCKQYGIAGYGAGYADVYSTSLENGQGAISNVGVQTGADILWQDAQGPMGVHTVRSESRRLCWCSWANLYSTRTIFQDAQPTPGTTEPVGALITGTYVGGDGADYIVTSNAGNFSGYATQASPAFASGGSSSTLVDQNVTVTGSVTTGAFSSLSIGETMTQTTTGATALRVSAPANGATITGTLTSGSITFGDSMQQATSGVTCTAGSGNTATQFSCSNFSGTADSSHTWNDITSGATFTPNAAPSFAAANPVLTMGPVTGSPDNSHTWCGGTSGGCYTPNQLPQGTNWTVNTFAGQFASVLTGTNTLCYATIASNTANTLTISGSWITRYPYTVCPGPDSTSTFVIEPGWAHSGTVTSGGMQMQYNNSLVVGGAPDNKFMLGSIKDSFFGGGQLGLGTQFGGGVEISNTLVTRQDWFGDGASSSPAIGNYIANDLNWDVHVIGLGGRLEQNWSLTALGGAQYSGSDHKALGAKALCWETGTVNVNSPSPPNTSANEVCIGGRSYPGLGTDNFIQRVEVTGGISAGKVPGIGPPTPTGTDQNGYDFPVLGGAGTGAGTPGCILWEIGISGSSGIVPNTGSTIWKVCGSGHLLAQTDNTNDIGASGANRPRNIFAGTAFTGPVYKTTTNCGAVGSAANPSLVACGSSSAGAFSCDAAASAATCVISTTAVGANSEIIVQETTKENTRLGVTCNTSPTVIPGILVASQSAGVSFTINMPTITTNPACFDYWIVNQ